MDQNIKFHFWVWPPLSKLRSKHLQTLHILRTRQNNSATKNGHEASKRMASRNLKGMFEETYLRDTKTADRFSESSNAHDIDDVLTSHPIISTYNMRNRPYGDSNPNIDHLSLARSALAHAS